MALTAITLCASALIKIGAQPIASFEDGTAEGEVAKSLYPGVRDALLASHPWSFATTQAVLPRLAQSPSAEFRYAFQLPPDFLRAISAGTAGRATGLLYRIQGSKLLTDVEAVALTHIFRPDESSFPPFLPRRSWRAWPRNSACHLRRTPPAQICSRAWLRQNCAARGAPIANRPARPRLDHSR